MPDSALFESIHARPALPDPAALLSARVHEAVGPGRRAFALALAGLLQGPVVWIHDPHRADPLHAPGIAAILDPARLVLVRMTGAMGLLQAMEESLRSAAAPLVVAELPEAPDLTASRRLQLAAGTGGGRGLCLVPEGQLRNNASETRWMCMPMPGQGGQHWEALKNKRGRLLTWRVRCTDGRFLAVESELA